MALKCQVCSRGPKSAQSRSHSNIATKRRQHLNLQTKTIAGKKTKICTRCMKTLAKSK